MSNGQIPARTSAAATPRRSRPAGTRPTTEPVPHRRQVVVLVEDQPPFVD